MNRVRSLMALVLLVSANFLQAAPSSTELEVWANEAIVATYTYSYKNYLMRQQAIAKYFTATGWMAYSTALNSSGLPDMVKKHSYTVSAVATLPPVVKTINSHQWEATMPLLVLYQSAESQKKQTLMVTINFGETPGSGIRDLAINNLQAKISEPPCECSSPMINNKTTTSPH